MKAFLNGKFVEKTEKVITLENRGLTFRDGLFEVIRVKEGHFFLQRPHGTNEEQRCIF